MSPSTVLVLLLLLLDLLQFRYFSIVTVTSYESVPAKFVFSNQAGFDRYFLTFEQLKLKQSLLAGQKLVGR